MNMRRVFAALAGKVRRLASSLSEKPEVQIDDYVLEHFLLYNGLVGSNPENQREFRDVRNDIVQAVNDRSAHELAIALKLPPLWWETRLEKVFAEIAEINREAAVHCLLALRPPDDTTGDTTPLSHSNWQVRANAAKMLAFLDAKESVPRLSKILDECSNGHKAAFCHVAYSLSKLGTEQARQALLPHIHNEEPWFCVDAVGSLAHWNPASVARDLMSAMLSGSELDDYMAVTIARRYVNLQELSEFTDAEVHEGFAELSMALQKAIEGPFHAEHRLVEQLDAIATRVDKLAQESPTPRRLRAAISINRRSDQESKNTNSGNQIRDLSKPEHYEAVKLTVTQAKCKTSAEAGQLRHALSLTAQFKLNELSPHLIPLIKSDFPALPELMESLAALGVLEAATPLTAMIKDSVNLDSRTSLPFSAHPVVETDKAATDIYWRALKALGALPHESSLDLLQKAVNDYAPDKREQALESLQTILLTESLRDKFAGNLQELLRERLNDPSTAVQLTAAQGVAQHKFVELIPELLKLLQAREASTQRRASELIVGMAAAGCREQVKQVLESSLAKEVDSSKKERINRVLQRIRQSP
jgi:HEAT repeat protein